MTGSIFTRYRIVDEHPYLSREDEYPDLTLAEAAAKMEDLTSCGADVILADFDEPCGRCAGCGEVNIFMRGMEGQRGGDPCPACHGAGKRREPWEWTDDESGREVTMRLEVS